jgi:methyl-accepting chemotaxis protein
VSQVSKAMATVDQVTQRNASAAEELSSTAEEMAAQAEALQQLIAFFAVREQAGAPGARQAGPAPHHANGVARRDPAPSPLPPRVLPPPPALPERRNGAAGAHGDGGFKRF